MRLKAFPLAAAPPLISAVNLTFSPSLSSANRSTPRAQQLHPASPFFPNVPAAVHRHSSPAMTSSADGERAQHEADLRLCRRPLPPGVHEEGDTQNG